MAQIGQENKVGVLAVISSCLIISRVIFVLFTLGCFCFSAAVVANSQNLLINIDASQEKHISAVNQYISASAPLLDQKLSPSSALLLAQLYKLIGFSSEADKIFSTLVSGKINRETLVQIHFPLIEYYLINGELKKTKTELSRIKNDVPVNLRDDYNRLQSKYYFATNNINSLASLLKTSNAESTWSHYARQNLAFLLFQKKRNDEAIDFLKQAIDLPHKDQESIAFRNRALIDLAKFYTNSDQFSLANATLSKVSLIGINSNQTLLNVGRVLYQTEQFRTALNILLDIESRQTSNKFVADAAVLIPRLLELLDKQEAALMKYKIVDRQLSSQIRRSNKVSDEIRDGLYLQEMGLRKTLRSERQIYSDSFSRSLIKQYPYLGPPMLSNKFELLVKNYRIVEYLQHGLKSQSSKKTSPKSGLSSSDAADAFTVVRFGETEIKKRLSAASVSLEKQIQSYLLQAVADYQQQLKDYQWQIRYFKASLYDKMLYAQDNKP